jgi:hypothetical protein
MGLPYRRPSMLWLVSGTGTPLMIVTAKERTLRGKSQREKATRAWEGCAKFIRLLGTTWTRKLDTRASGAWIPFDIG